MKYQSQFESFFSRRLRQWPHLRRAISRLWRVCNRGRLRLKNLIDHVDWDRILLIDPASIRYRLTNSDSIDRDRIGVYDGDWDLPENLLLWDEYFLYQSLRQRFIDGADWKKTEFYDSIRQEIAGGKELWGCSTVSQFDCRLEALDRLFCDIKTQGFRAKTEIGPTNSEPIRWYHDDISIAIGRHGELIFNDGRHRLSIAKILQLRAIPVRVTQRHRQWMEYRRKLARQAARSPREELSDPLTHPDLQDISALHRDDRR